MTDCVIDLSIDVETTAPANSYELPKQSSSSMARKTLNSKLAKLMSSLSSVDSRIAVLEKQLRPLKKRKQSLIADINSIKEELDFLPQSEVWYTSFSLRM